ncbi:GNAT family N-acetyltransferase [Sphingomonas oleivorans]|uniref:GNAT family N-acetyltransferase n=1 Tax=Sphingomonas oleivorans TaxID=1735121 RepID=A0A2T5G236_9SPHN|nr:GNAT family N-acetyltransferase [Sphingomonas oleivorans]PTQ13219.1 GNAT family N-acetyltransferase [Sphingomonas oleivorans]
MLIEVPIAFRIAHEEDLPALEWMGLFTRQREIIAATFEAQRQGEALMLLALANGFPVGQAWLDFDRQGSLDCPRIWAIRIFPPFQGAGLGTRLMAEVEAVAAARGAWAVELGVEWDNEGARRFYRRLGYEPVGAEREEVRYTFKGCPMAMEVDQQILRKDLQTEG